MTQWTAQWGTGQLPQDDDGITARPIQPGDAGLIDEMHRRLSPESLYFRYLQPRIPPLAEIEQVCTLPSEKGAGFVATVHEEKEKVVSVAYYVREAHEPRPTAEPGILVEDRFQGQGIGRRLWRQLHDQARADRIAQLRVFLAPNNQPMLRLLQGSGFAYQARAHAGLSEYLVSLGEQAAAQPLASVAGLRAGHFSLPPQLAQRLVLYRGELYPVPASYRLLRVHVGAAYVTHDGQDHILPAGEELQLNRTADVALVSAIGCEEVVIELFDSQN